MKIVNQHVIDERVFKKLEIQGKKQSHNQKKTMNILCYFWPVR